MTQPTENDSDLAMSRRLRRLASAPVDLSNLEARIAMAIPRPAEVVRRKYALKPYLTAAASLAALVATVSMIVLAMPRRVLASTEMLNDLYSHNDAMRVESPTDAPMPCCVRQVEGRNVTCVTIEVAGKRVMMTVGDGKHFKVPDSAGRKVVDGVEYRHQSSGAVNMVMTVRDGAWICLMGEPTVDELVASLAATARPGK